MAKNLKKSLLITLDFPPNVGGIATYYYNVCKNLPADKIVVLAPEQEGAEAFDRQQNFTIIRKKILSQLPENSNKGLGKILKVANSFRWMSTIKHLAPIIKNHQIELIQAGQVLPIGTMAMVYSKSKKIPFVFYAHGLDIMLPQNFKRKKMLVKNIIDSSQKIIANSHYTKDELITLGATEDKVIVVHPCPNLTTEQVTDWKIEEIKEDFNLKNKKILLTVGRLVKRKGHDYVIQALPTIIKQVPGLIYIIAGSGPYQKNLEKLVNQKNLGGYVKFVGNVDQKDLAAFYSICNVFTMPSRQLANGDVEGFGIAYLEANLFGKPVIGGKSGGVPEAVIDRQTGFLVNPTDVEEIAKVSVKLLTDDALAAKLGTQGLERVTNEFEWDNQTEKIKDILT
ncbi:MAG: hypothetical protein CMI53_00115 [Parcubacteria group bacterium]|nr:hypothetical protein [Parcubacteria group bacterium]|tara:strand:- start:2149 stop:3336 length:1188 start_codon:yes stop_codon:yes gene_type:complete